MSQTDEMSGNKDTTLRLIAYLWYELAFARALMWLANPTGRHSFQPHVYLYLADRYGCLAAAYRHRSKFTTADRLTEKAEHHFRLGGGDEPPPAAALAVGINEPRAVFDGEDYRDPTENEGQVLPFIPKKPSSMVRIYRGDA